jgi:GT2 family glycosyltransferase/tetratricopeptide (TPR) repeat protein
MSQFTATVVIPVWNQWQMTQACLESLRPTLGVHDTVIVVDNGSEDFTSTGLKQFPWVTVITNEVNQGFAVACNQGAAAATGDVVIFLNNDTLVPSRWLEGLLWPFADTKVFGTGPRSNFVSGPQLVAGPGYAQGSMSDFRRWAKQWREDHRGQVTETHRLVGFCLAIRRDIFNQVGGFDETFGTGGAEDDDLCLRLVNAGGRLLICHESFVHHHGHATFDANGLDWFAIQQANMDRLVTKHGGQPVRRRNEDVPLLSACMIVKDEADILPACLESLTGVVDEVVIYDTGSTDGTIELARAAGAKVIEGYWDDDFGRARNESLAHCSGEWAMHIDADEVFEGDAKRMRHVLANSPFSAYQMEILNLSGDEKNSLTHRPARVFKRAIYHWQGRLHEQLTMRDGTPRDDFGIIEGAKLIHSGYTPELMAKKNKAERNIRIAQLDADSDEERDAIDRMTNLGRSLTMAGRFEEALAIYTEARELESDSPVVWRTLYRAGAQAALHVGRPHEALSWAEDLERVSHFSDTARYFKGIAHTSLGHWQEGYDALQGMTSMRDDDGVVFPYYVVQINRARCLYHLDRFEEAVNDITPVATEETLDEPIWALVADSFYKAGRSLQSLMLKIPSQHMNAIFAQITTAIPAAADAMLEELYNTPERQASVLALAIKVAPKLSIERAAEWSVRLRQVGLETHCPLIVMANDMTIPFMQRLRAAGLASGAFSDERGLGAIKSLSMYAPTNLFIDALEELNALSAALLEPFVVGASTDATRALAMAKALHQLGAPDEALAVLKFGLATSVNNSRVADEAAAWLESTGNSKEAAEIRHAAKA